MPFLCVLLRGTLERFVGSDHDARRLLDVLDRHRCPAVRLHFGNFTLSPGDERGSAPAAVVQEQHAPTVRELGLMPGRNGHLTGIANPLGEIDEGHQARDCTHLVIFYLIQGRAGRSRLLLERLFELVAAPLNLARVLARPPASRGSARRGRRGRQTKPRTVKRSSHSLTYASGTRQRRRSRASGTACATSRTSFVTSPTHAKAAGGPALRSTTLGRTSAAPTRSSLRGSQMLDAFLAPSARRAGRAAAVT